MSRMTLKNALLGVLTLLVVAAGASTAVVYGGMINVAATDRHWTGTEWALHTTMQNSVRRAARGITPPDGIDLRDPALAERAFGHYSVACTTCHGAPGVGASPWMITNPPSPLLVETAGQWSDGELYWIVKHGIKMTGMPALGPTHADHDLWAIAAFVRQLPTMTPEEYQAMSKRHEERKHAEHGAHAHHGQM
jgi:mono/diheme cytochrome c family protein